MRLRGLYLAVTTLAFALAVQSWLLNEKWFHWFPASNQRLERPPLFGRIDIDGATAYYWYAVIIVTAVVFASVIAVRRSRTGRVIVAVRDNERVAQSFAVPAVRAKLTAFTMSGAIAGIGGALHVHLNQAFSLGTFSGNENLRVFVAAVVGGLGSPVGAVLGATYLRGTQWFITDPSGIYLTTAAGVLLVLLIVPGGLVSGSCVSAMCTQRGCCRRTATATAPPPIRQASRRRPSSDGCREGVPPRRAPPGAMARRRVRRRPHVPAGDPVRPQRRR